MTFRALAVPGAWELTPTVHPDERGLFYQWFTDSEFQDMTGHRFDFHQANVSVSAAGALRGLHFAELPPSQAKYVTCLSGAVRDVVVDIRIGSPTFGRWDAVLLDARERRSVYLAEGLAHGFVALQDNTTVAYLCSASYDPAREHTIDATDPALGIDWGVAEPIRSARDAAAPPLAAITDLLPTWDACRDFLEKTTVERTPDGPAPGR
jgi:dTDP-4-dehydrorhamnose 3,5-epimerase